MSALKVPLLTFPTIFIRGSYLGGMDQLIDAESSGRLDELLRSERVHFPGTATMAIDRLKLCTGPRGQPWYCFQLHAYANFVRVVSAFHVLLFAIWLGVASTVADVAMGIALAIIFDLAVFVILGPTPLAPLCTLATALAWRFRGDAVSSLPYKVVFGVYVFGLSSVLLCGDRYSECAARTTSRLTISGLLTNSALLAILRF